MLVFLWEFRVSAADLRCLLSSLLKWTKVDLLSGRCDCLIGRVWASVRQSNALIGHVRASQTIKLAHWPCKDSSRTIKRAHWPSKGPSRTIKRAHWPTESKNTHTKNAPASKMPVRPYIAYITSFSISCSSVWRLMT